MTDTDRELLELAAKAAGLEYECVSHTGRPENDQHQVRDQFGGLVDWNPLTEDDDALRLAVKLEMLVDIDNDSVSVFSRDGISIVESCIKDQFAATRRAIVCVAAEIGRRMK